MGGTFNSATLHTRVTTTDASWPTKPRAKRSSAVTDVYVYGKGTFSPQSNGIPTGSWPVADIYGGGHGVRAADNGGASGGKG